MFLHSILKWSCLFTDVVEFLLRSKKKKRNYRLCSLYLFPSILMSVARKWLSWKDCLPYLKGNVDRRVKYYGKATEGPDSPIVFTAFTGSELDAFAVTENNLQMKKDAMQSSLVEHFSHCLMF